MTFLGNTLNAMLAMAAGDAGGGFWMPPRASTIAESIDWVFFFIYWICVFFFVLIMGLMIVFIVKYRRRAEGEGAASNITHHTPLEITWTVIPLILVIAIFFMGLRSYVDLVEAPKNAYEVNVTGQQWSWLFEHRNGATDDRILKVPAGRPVKLIMTSQDVLHAMFIPAFRVKQDLVPGRFTYLWFEAMEPGTHQLFCAEYCGTAHSQMAGFVEVLPPDEFERQIEEDARWLDEVPDEQLHKAGLRLYSRCASCHTLDGTNLIGPSFRETHENWGKPRVMQDGRSVTIDENYIQNSILNPAGDIVANYPNQMPSFAGQLDTRAVQAISEFIKRLDEVVDASGNPIE
jgi:cytochrome c oxidase subunit 2